MTSKISQKIIAKIKKEKIKPEPKWKFIYRNYLIWILAMFMVVFGAISFSITIFTLKHVDLETLKYIEQTRLKFIFFIIPFLWKIFFVIFIILSYFAFKKTRTGYRYHFLFLSGVILITSIILGYFIYILGFGEKLNRALNQTVSIYRNVSPVSENRWHNPEKGLLAGEIIEIKSNQLIIVSDIEEKIWKVELPNDLPNNQKMIDHLNQFLKDNPDKPIKVKIVGEKINDEIFRAHFIKPWKPLPLKPRR
jgi:heme/copper-type cytochrome/quinol oxidase subunit 2